MFNTLLWNEWRQKQTTVIFLILLTIVLWGTVFLLFKLKVNDDIISMLLTGIFAGLSILYCAVLTNTPAMEFERKTAPLLQSLPIPSGMIYLAKYLFSLITTIILCLFLGVIFEYSISLQECLAIMKVRLTDTGFCFPVALLMLHSCVFFCSIVSRNTANNVAGLLVFPVLIAASTPIMAPVFIFTEKVNLFGALNFVVILSMFYFIVLTATGYFLYVKRIMRGLPILKPLICLGTAAVILPWIVCGITYGWTQAEFEFAKSNAKKAGLVLDYKKYSLPLPEGCHDISMEAMVFRKNYSKWLSKVKSHMNNSFFGFTDHYITYSSKKNPNTFPSRKTSIAISQELYKNKKMAELYADVPKIAMVPNAGISPGHDLEESFQNQYSVYKIVKFLSLRNRVCYYSGHREEILPNLKLALHLYKLMNAGKFFWCKHRTIIIALNNAVKYGEFTTEWHQFYEQLLTLLNNSDIATGRNDASQAIYLWTHQPKAIVKQCLGKIDIRYLYIPPHDPNNIHFFQYTIALPRTLHFMAKHLILLTDIHKLYKKALTTPRFKEIKAEHETLAWKYFKRKCFYSEVKNYYESRNLVNFNTVTTALLIYRCGNGRFPKQLKQLSPQILPKVPVSAFTGKPFSYQPQGKGFVLTNDTFNSLYGKKSSRKIDYQPPALIEKGGKK